MDLQDLGYICQILEAMNALENFHCLPFSGGYLDQPITFIRDIQAARSVVSDRMARKFEAVMAARDVQAQGAQEWANNPLGAPPLPEIPEELLSG